MDEPIISPWLFYWVGVMNSYDAVNGILFLVLTFMMVLLIPALVDDGGVNKEKANCIIKKALYVWIFMFLGIIFIPSKETTYKMIIAQYVTPRNTEIATQNAERLIERISNLVLSKVKEERNEKIFTRK